MRFIKEITPKGLLLPVTAARLVGFEANDASADPLGWRTPRQAPPVPGAGIKAHSSD